MRRVSNKRREVNRAAKPVRDALIAKHGECMICRASPKHPHRGMPAECSQLCCHEVANGPSRGRALDKPYAILVLCWYCNGHVVTNKKEWPESRQLACLLESSPGDFDLAAYNALINPNAPNRITMEDVEQWSRGE